MNRAFAPIHNHTQYSALDGLATPLEIAKRCQCIGCTSCGITDHGTVAGHLEFAEVMYKHDIKPIFGVEFYHGVKPELAKGERDQYHFVAGALTDEGLRNVWRMVDAASDPQNYRYVGRLNFDICERFSDGVFATSACIQGLVAQEFLQSLKDPDMQPPGYLLGVLDRYLEIYRDNFYIEIHTYPGEEHEQLNQYLVKVAHERGIPLIYATDAHFAGPEQYEIHDAYVAMQTGEHIFMPTSDRKMWHPKSLYIQSEAEIRQSLSYLPESVVGEALSNSADLAARCNARLPSVRRHLPVFIPAECPWHEGQENAALMFLKLIEEGLHKRYGDAGEEVWNKAAYEAEVMLTAGLEHYFLQVWDFCEFCNREGIARGPGRGSAAGSIVAYALGITDIDPLRYDLIFERFWNPGRAKGFPDIDIDFPITARKRVRRYLMERWGEDKVRTIGTTMRLKPKSVLDKTQKVCAVAWEEKEELKKIIATVPDIDIHGADTIGWADWVDPGKVIYVMHPTAEYPHNVGEKVLAWLEAQPEHRQGPLLRWLSIVEVLCSRVSGYGVHPSGVVVSDVPLAAELPCMYNRAQDVQVTCFPMADVDNRQFPKDDLLGLRNLDTLERWEELTDQHPDWHALTYEELPEEMWKLLDQGLTFGVFQIEEGYARQLCKDMKPRSIEDLAVIVAMNRPGPIRANVPDSYVRRKNGQEEVTYDHPLLEPITADTYGHLVYQEQIIRFFSALGYSDGDADEVRKILGKKKPEVMATVRYGEGEWQGKGYMQAAIAAGIPESIANKLWEKIEGFASYSFNKSHAIAYATMAFRTLYIKWADKEQAVIASIQTDAERAGGYVSEGRRRGVEIKPPDIRRSGWDITKAGDGEVLFGFSNVKGIGKGTAQYIVTLRDAYPTIMTREELEQALDREQEIWAITRSTPKSPQQKLNSGHIGDLEAAGAFDNYMHRDISLEQRQEAEKTLLQVILTDNCEKTFLHHSNRIEKCDTYYELETEDVGVRVDIPGVIASVTPKKTKRDSKPMGIVTIEYQGDEAEFVVFPRQWNDYRSLWKERTPAIFTLVKSQRGTHFEDGVRLD